MSNPKQVWEDLRKKLGDDIGIWCKQCAPSSRTEPRKDCKHAERSLWVYCRSSATERDSWAIARERPPEQIDQLCLNKRCKRTKKCRKAHSQSELEIWKTLKHHGKFLHNFVKTLIYYEEESTPAPIVASVKPKKSRTKNRSKPNDSKRMVEYEGSKRKFDQVLQKCGGGTFFFACKRCCHLEPKIIKEMEIGLGKDPRIYCLWCGQNKKNYFLLHETTEKNKNDVTFYEYQWIRDRLSTTYGTKLCRHLPNCQAGEDCTFAHSYFELAVWEIEACGLTRIDLVRYCDSGAGKRSTRETLHGMFHCDRCCISFRDHRTYSKYMGSNHKHFPEVCRPPTYNWIFRPLPPREDTPSMCRTSGCPGNWSCAKAHTEQELIEWKQRLTIKMARERFRFQYETQTRVFNQHQRPEPIHLSSDVKVEVKSTQTTMKFETKTNKWNIKISTNSGFLKRIGFPRQSDFQIRRTINKEYQSVIEMPNGEPANEFVVLFTNPDTYGRHVGDLIFEFTDNERPYYLRFEVKVEGESLQLSDRVVDPNDWTRNRLIVKYQSDGQQLASYDKSVRELESKYPLPKLFDSVVDRTHIAVNNYKEKIHSLLYREEHARRTVLSRLNMLCKIQFHELTPEGHLLADFTIPWSISTDAGLLFRNSCNMVYLGEVSDDHAYECKKCKSGSNENITIDLSPECVSGLKIEPGTSREFRVQFQLDRGLFCLRHYAVDEIEASLVCPSLRTYATLQYNGEPMTRRDLNDAQNAIFNHVQLKKQKVSGNEQKSYPPLIVVGPFGTGKTHTIKEIILDLMENGDDYCTVLLCTHSNSSADLYVKDPRLQQWLPKVLRLYYHDRRPETVEDSVKKFCLLNGSGFRYPRMSEIRKKRLVITTFATALTLVLETGLQKNAFTHIFLDEASQVMEADVIMPLLLAGRHNTRIVLAGDHRQITEKMYSDQFDRLQTLLERMYEEYENVSKRCRILLTMNYRSAPGIISLLTKLFYKENVLDYAGTVKCLPSTESAYFVHLQGKCSAVQGEYVNGDEANQIKSLVKWVIQNKLADEQDILAVSAFYPQVQYIRQVLRKDELSKVSVQPVGNIQGQQFKVVLISCVMRRVQCLETYGENFGFLSDYRLLNTVLTRAQSLIIVVGDAVTLCSVGKCERYWKTFLRHCQENDTFYPKKIDVESVKKEIFLAKQKLNASAAEFTPSINPAEKQQENSDQTNQDHGEEVQQETSSEDSSPFDDDDNDSWCSEDSADDMILDDMIKSKTGIDLQKVTVGVGPVGNEYICYSSGEEDDPNETSELPSRREAIHPKFTIGHLEPMLKMDSSLYKRCKIVMDNWYSARAIPIHDGTDENRLQTEVLSVTAEASVKSDASDNSEDESESDSEPESSPKNETMKEDAPTASAVTITPVTNHPEIFIETKRNLGRSFDKDEVLVQIIGTRNDPIHHNRKKQIGKVLGILQKRNLRERYFLCRPDELNSCIMCPFNKKVTKFAILAPKNHRQSSRSDIPIYKAVFQKGKWMDLYLLGYKEADSYTVYVVRYLKWSDHCRYPLGFVEGCFDLGDYKKFLQLEYGVPSHYRKAVLAQAEKVKPPEPDKNVIEVFTIDPEGSADLDDAISFRKCASHTDCFEIGIHITDVASVIKEGSPIDKDALRRIATFYGSDDGPVHMLPPALIANVCSILPGEVRYAISTYFHSRDGPPHSKDFNPVTPKRTLIKSVRKLTYGEAELLFRDRIKGKPLSSEDVVFADNMREMWKIMWDWRVSRLGGEAFYKNADSYTEIFDECRAHLLIEEAMVSVNANTASYLRDQDFDIPMRVQDVPDEREFTDWDRVHTNLIPNSSYLTSCSKYLKKLKRIEEGDEVVEDVQSEDEDGGQWEEAVSRRRKRNRIKKGMNPVTASIDPIGHVLIFEKYWKDMLDCKEENDLELFSFVAACDDLHPSLISSADRYRGLQKKGTISSTQNFHFSLRISNYAWSSSPIRRYIDIAIQRCIHKALVNERPTDMMNSAMERVCRCYDNRHSQYEEKLLRANLATFLQNQPIVFEACITQITDAFIKISIPPMGKLMLKQEREIQYGCLMLTKGGKSEISDVLSDEQQLRIDGKIVLASIDLIWKLRYYEYETKIVKKRENEPSTVMKIPIKCWRAFVEEISKPPRLSDSEYKKSVYLKDVVGRMTDTASRDGICRSVELKGYTTNNPDPIPHRREIQWKTIPGTSILVQLSGSTDRVSRLPVPTVQLFSVSDDLDVCVEHMREPVNTFAPDAEHRKGKVTSLVSYRKKWEPLIRMDAAYNTVKENASLTIQGVSITWRKALTQDEDNYKHKIFAEEKEQVFVNCFELKHSFCFDRYIDFHCGDLLCLRLKNVPSAGNENHRTRWKCQFTGTRSTYTAVIHGVIDRVIKPDKFDRNKNKHVEVCFKVFKENFPEIQSGFVKSLENKWTIEVIPLLYVHRHMHSSFTKLHDCSPLIRSICLGTIQSCRVDWADAIEEFVEKQLKKFPLELNPVQKKQERYAMRHNFSLIQGPPGTGKSFLAAQIAAKFAYINKMVGNGQKVLYCGPSNKSVDVAAGFLKDVNDIRVVRMYSVSLEEKLYPNPLKPCSSIANGDDGKKPDENLKLITLHKLIRSSENSHSEAIRTFDTKIKSGMSFTREEMEKYHGLVREAKLHELSKADIVICTCSVACRLKDMRSSAGTSSANHELKFSQCIIDECAMCSEPETILPLVATNPSQVVLIGDHQQLQPVITCPRAEQLGLGVSLFSRYSEYAEMLTNQYRMHPNIMEFPSRQFYGGRLTCDVSVTRRTRPRKEPFRSRNEAIFWNVPGEERTQHFKTTEEGYLSKYNIAQAMAVVKILQRLDSYQIHPSQIMVLSPYTAQCVRIRETISSHFGRDKARDFHVGTVVTSQGSEADYVIISTVRSLPNASIMDNPNVSWMRKNLGFLTDPHQINVALTRARRRLFIIGNQRLLRVDALWDKLLKFYQSRHAVTEHLI